MAATEISTSAVPAASILVGSSNKLRLGALTALLIGSMVGSGVFSLPRNMSAAFATR